MSMRALAVGLGAWLVGGAAWAAPGDLPERSAAGVDDDARAEAPVGEDAEALTILSSSTKKCTSSGLCLFAGARATAVDPAPVASATHAKLTVVPRFQRLAAVAAAPRAERAPGPAVIATAGATGSWTLELAGALKKPAWAGNAVFLFYDLADEHAIDEHQTTALYQAKVKAGHALAARLSLSPEDGFRPDHTYRLRVVQIIGGKEVILGETDFSLL